MKRKTFLKTCGFAAIAIPLGSGLLHSCTSYYYASFKREGNQLIIPLDEFYKDERERKFVLLDSPFSNYSICVFKTEKDAYTASLMRCTHKGCEVNVEGEMFSCPCHGSEFSNKGEVLEGPATEPLQTYKITTDAKNLYVTID